MRDDLAIQLMGGPRDGDRHIVPAPAPCAWRIPWPAPSTFGEPAPALPDSGRIMIGIYEMSGRRNARGDALYDWKGWT